MTVPTVCSALWRYWTKKGSWNARPIFIFELLETRYMYRRYIDVFYSNYTANWNLKGKSDDRSDNIKANVTYGTNRINAYKIIEDTLNLRDVRIFDTVYEDGNEERVLNKKETAIAQQKQETIKEAFQGWIWKDPKRRERLTRIYNDLYNSNRPREYYTWLFFWRYHFDS